MGVRGNHEEPPLETGRAIVLGGHYGALSVARALAEEGVVVMVVASDPRDHACHTRFASACLIAPDPEDGPDMLLQSLMALDDRWADALLIPTLDEYVIFVSQNCARLAGKFRFAVPEWDVLRRVVDKSRLYALAAAEGVPSPDFFVPESVAALESSREALAFPCLVKPFESRRFSEVYGSKVLLAHDFGELTRYVSDAERRGLDVMICEIIPGEVSTIFSHYCYIDSTGEVLGEMCSRKMQQYPRRFGQGSVHTSIPMIRDIREGALKLLRGAGYRGEADTEFKFDRRDGLYKLMEINTRPVVSERLFVEAGVNFPYLAYRDLVEDIRVPVSGYKTNVTWIHNHWELVSLLRSVRTRSGDVARTLRSYRGKRVYAVPFWDDPGHFIREVWQHTGRALDRIGDRRQ